MNEKNSARNDYFYSKTDRTLQAVLPSVLVSFLLHMIFFTLLFYTPGSLFKKKITPSTINVDLVSLPEYYSEPGTPETKKSMKQETKQPEPENKTGPPPKNSETLASKKTPVSPGPVKKKTSLKKKTFKTQKVIENTLKEVEKKVDDAGFESVTKALEQIKKNLDRTRPEKKSVQDVTPSAQDREKKSGPAMRLQKMEIYLLQVKEIFNKNWAFSEQIAGESKNLESIVVCTILPNGNIGDVWFEKRSGSSHLDDSAYKAILKSGPLPPLPEGYTKPYTAGYVFTPSGVQ